MTLSLRGWEAFATPRALTHTRIIWALSPIMPQVPGITLGSPLCPWCCEHSSWRGVQHRIYYLFKNENIALYNKEANLKFYLVSNIWNFEGWMKVDNKVIWNIFEEHVWYCSDLYCIAKLCIETTKELKMNESLKLKINYLKELARDRYARIVCYGRK